ncbi:MAG: thiamine phosphate synthase [Candidatus Diapherotrites archaeon]|uniref:Thiamine-phosphate synthase n=1 Tax=Candidatus Iainarchaeum sp. TaxID=3101447 RepID=A0A938YQR7_9ARCH|nr:thiamine phosphate synthase [Candidatus Diapherotrites archaeon]
MEISGLYFVTDSRLSKQGILQDVKKVIEAGCRIVQYREKEKSLEEKTAEAKELAVLCRGKGVLFIMNNDVEIAVAVEADGVHLGQEDMPLEKAREVLGESKIIGITVHNVKEALEAEKHGADYVSVSPIFHTDTKKDAGKPAGIELIEEAKERVKLPIVAIGGINEGNVQEVIKAGADSVAVISAIACSENPKEAAQRIIRKIAKVKEN